MIPFSLPYLVETLRFCPLPVTGNPCQEQHENKCSSVSHLVHFVWLLLLVFCLYTLPRLPRIGKDSSLVNLSLLGKIFNLRQYTSSRRIPKLKSWSKELFASQLVQIPVSYILDTCGLISSRPPVISDTKFTKSIITGFSDIPQLLFRQVQTLHSKYIPPISFDWLALPWALRWLRMRVPVSHYFLQACGKPRFVNPPRVWTWPWLGSLFSYTRDPVGFIQKNHNDYGDVFTTKILGYNCTFIRSNAHLSVFATATRKVLDVTAAYKIVAAPLIGEEAFFGQTRYMNQVVLSAKRIDKLNERLWELTGHLIECQWKHSLRSKTQPTPDGWYKMDIARMLDQVIFGLDVFVLIGDQMVNNHIDHISELFRVLDSDLSLTGILRPMFKLGHSPRHEAKIELLRILEEDVRRRVEYHIQSRLQALYERDADQSNPWDSSEPKRPRTVERSIPETGFTSLPKKDLQLELPDMLLKSELMELEDSVLMGFTIGDKDAVRAIESKIKFIAIFIYGFVWAAQTNSAAATIGVVHDIIYNSHSPYAGGCGEQEQRASHVDVILDQFQTACAKKSSRGVPAYEDMPHLTQCINETLRLRATGAWIRLADKPFLLADSTTERNPPTVCPEGFIVLSPMSVSLNPQVYPDPNSWDPYRFERAPFVSDPRPVGGQKLAQHIPLHPRHRTPPATPSAPYFASWGIGQGHCPGQHLAYKMISLTVSKFLTRFEIRPIAPSSEMAQFQDIAAAGVQRLKSGFKVYIRRRREVSNPGV